MDRKKDILRKNDDEKKWKEEDEWASLEKMRKMKFAAARQEKPRAQSGWDLVDSTPWAKQALRERLLRHSVEASGLVAMVVDVRAGGQGTIL